MPYRSVSQTMGRDPNAGRQDYVDGSPRLRGMVAKTCKLPHVKEKVLRTQDFKSEKPFFYENITILRRKSRN